MTTVRFDRLEKLATFVEMGGPPGHRFDMTVWGNRALADQSECGTRGCMGGLATLLWPKEIWLMKTSHVWGQQTYLNDRWSYESERPTNVMARLLGISEEESDKLFGAVDSIREKSNDNKHHARRLRDFIARKAAEEGVEL